MKNICFIAYNASVIGGVERVTVSLANALADHYRVHLVSLCGQNKCAFALDERVSYTVLGSEDRLRNMRRTAKPRLAKFLKENDIAVAFLQETYAAFIASSVRFATKTKLVFCDHGALMNQWHRKDMVFIRLLCSVLCSRTVTLTRQSMDAYRRRLLTPGRKLRCIYNWIDLDVPRSDGYRIHSRRILSAGRFGSEKGFDRLVEAFAPVAQKHPDWQLDLYGDGEMLPRVQQMIFDRGIENNVTLMGMRSDLSACYRNYAFYVLPSYREGMPLVLLEAKANRLPIVSFDILTGPREIVRDGIDGILVPPDDLEGLTDAMCSMIEAEALRQSMSDRSQDNLNIFSKPTILAQWRELIDTL